MGLTGVVARVYFPPCRWCPESGPPALSPHRLSFAPTRMRSSRPAGATVTPRAHRMAYKQALPEPTVPTAVAEPPAASAPPQAERPPVPPVPVSTPEVFRETALGRVLGRCFQR